MDRHFEGERRVYAIYREFLDFGDAHQGAYRVEDDGTVALEED